MAAEPAPSLSSRDAIFLEVKPSLIPGAGMGLFARRFIRNGKRIARYRGVSYNSFDAAYKSAPSHKPYFMRTIGGGIIDGYTSENTLRWVNHSRTPNAWAHLESDGVVYFEALRGIEAGEEITINYDEDYDFSNFDPQTVPRCLQCGTALVLCTLLSITKGPERICLQCMAFVFK